MKKILIIGVVMILILAADWGVGKYKRDVSNQEFLSRLTGQVVYLNDGSIYTILANGTEKKLVYKLAELGDGGLPQNPRWSEDSKITFSRLDGDSEKEFIIGLDGQGLAETGREGSALTVTSRAADLVVESDGLYRLEGGQKIKLFAFSGGDPKAAQVYFADWSPDREQVIFEYCPGVLGLGSCKIMIVDKDGKTGAVLVEGTGPNWGPDRAD